MWYKKANNLGADNYTTNIKVNIYGGPDNTDMYVYQSVPVKFSIDVEAREWGIKNIGVVVEDGIEVPLSVIEYDENEMEIEKEVTILVDLSQITKEELKGKEVVTIGDLDLHLDKSGNVDYKMSLLSILTY